MILAAMCCPSFTNFKTLQLNFFFCFHRCRYSHAHVLRFLLDKCVATRMIDYSGRRAVEYAGKSVSVQSAFDYRPWNVPPRCATISLIFKLKSHFKFSCRRHRALVLTSPPITLMDKKQVDGVSVREYEVSSSVVRRERITLNPL